MIFTKVSHAIATHISLEAAIVFGVIEYWSGANARKKRASALKNGLYCCYMSWPDWEREVAFLSKNSIRRAIEDLKKHGVICVFKGDANSNRANYYCIDQKGWIKFQVWSSGLVLSAEDGRAMTPIDQQVPDADLDEDHPALTGHDTKIILPTQGIYPVHTGQDILPTQGSMLHTLERKNKKKDLTKNKFDEGCKTAPSIPAVEVESKKTKVPTDGALVYEAYRDAFQRRYGQDPIRNAKVNSVCSQVVKQIGVDEGQAVMHFYLQQNVSWYVQKSHAIEYALKDLQALRTNMLNNKAMSAREAQQVDKQQAQKNVLEDYLANREEYQKMFRTE
jgi:hypothetical protein